jgi:hypothetical protein
MSAICTLPRFSAMYPLFLVIVMVPFCRANPLALYSQRNKIFILLVDKMVALYTAGTLKSQTRLKRGMFEYVLHILQAQV